MTHMKESGNEQKSSKFWNDATFGNTVVVSNEWGTYLKFVSEWQFKRCHLIRSWIILLGRNIW